MYGLMDTAECLHKYALQFSASFFGRLVENEREKTSIKKRERGGTFQRR